MSETVASPISTTLTGEARRLLVHARIRAMRGDIAGASVELAAIAAHGTLEGAAAGSLLAELLYLNCQDDEAVLVFDRLVVPKRPILSADAQFVLDENHSVLRLARMETTAAKTFYHAVDRRRLAGFESLDPHEALDAEWAMAHNKPAEALPILWRGLTSAYRWGDWRAVRRASNRMLRLYLSLGHVDQSWHYILMAGTDEHLKQLAEALARHQNIDAVRAVIDRSLHFANLRHHFALSAKLFAKIAAIIPDDRVLEVVEWLLVRAGEHHSKRIGPQPTELAWKALTQLGWRVSPELASKCVRVAVSHPIWTSPLPGPQRFIFGRKEIVEAVNAFAPRLPIGSLPKLAADTLPLALDRMENTDYSAVVNLLCCIADRGGVDVKSQLAASLYQDGGVMNVIMAQVANYFGVAGMSPEKTEELFNRVVNELKLVIQKVSPDQVSKPMPETVMVRTSRNASGELAVTLHGTYGLQALVRERLNLSPESIVRLVRQLIYLISHRDNLLANRMNLLMILADFADRVTGKIRAEMVAALAPLATGPILESTELPTAAEGANPLSSSQFHMGNPEEVQAYALVALATFSAGDSASSRRAKEAIEEAMMHSSPTVRRGAYAAAGRLPRLSGEGLLRMVVGLRDPDPVAAREAFAAFARQRKWTLSYPQLKQFLLAIRLAKQSPDAGLRRIAAEALKVKRDSIKHDELAAQADQLLVAFGEDIDAEVRHAARHTESPV